MNNFNEILAEFAGELKIIDKLIISNCENRSDLILLLTQNLVNSGGKRIRPLLLLICAKLCGSKNDEKQYYMASAVEMIHSATLLHDDVIDNSEVRRGKKTANAIWDNKAAILVGDFLFSLSFQLMVKSENLKILDLLSTTSSIIADGEILQLQNSTNINLSDQQYFDIIFGKTAVLFSACCEVGALLNNCDDNTTLSLRNFGKNLGMIFQIIDDILDYNSKSDVLGKEIGNDFFEGKVTLPIIKTYQKANEEERNLLAKIFAENFQQSQKNYDNLMIVQELMKKYRAIEECKSIVENFAKNSVNDIAIFANNKFQKYLLTLINYSIERLK